MSQIQWNGAGSKKGILPTLAESRYVLVEFSGIDPYSRIRAVIYELTSAGFVPGLLHMVERCRCMAEHRISAGCDRSWSQNPG